MSTQCPLQSPQTDITHILPFLHWCSYPNNSVTISVKILSHSSQKMLLTTLNFADCNLECALSNYHCSYSFCNVIYSIPFKLLDLLYLRTA